jgi:hypothetical protein
VQGLLTGSRLAVAGIILQLIIYAITMWKASAAKKAGTLVGAVLIMLALVSQFHATLDNTEIWRKFSDTSIELSPDQNFRLYLASRFTAHSIENSNLIGDGPGTFGTLFSRHYDRDYYQRYGLSDREIAFAADSDYTNLLMQYGFIGLAVLCLLFWTLFSHVRPEGRPLLLLLFSFMILGMFALPVFTMRMPSFSLFTFLALERRRP